MEEQSESKPEDKNLIKINYEEELECAVCLQSCVHPVRLPCSHIFCFLCVKGAANQSKRCAMCRQEIPADFLENPHLLKKVEEKEYDVDGYQWFYEGRNGWWQYDERTSKDLETAYSRGDRMFEILVAGFLYTVDFDRMVQQRRNDPSRRRRIKRDLASIPKKGVAGLKTALNEPVVEEQSHNVASSSADNIPVSSSSSLLSNENPQNQDEDVASPNNVGTNSPSRSVSNLEASLRLSSEYQVLEYLHLLHSDIRNLHPNRIPDTSRPSWSSDLSINEATDLRTIRPYLTSRRNVEASVSMEQEQNFRTRLYSDPASPSQPLTLTNTDLEGSVAALTDHIDNLTIDSNDTDAQYYSLDDTVEYNLPNNNEDL